MKLYSYVLAVAALVVLSQVGHAATMHELFNYDPVASPSAIVSGCGDSDVGSACTVRFTVLTDRLIRIEQSGDGQFEDRATLAVLNRKVDSVPSFSHSTSNGVLTISTDAITLTHKIGQPVSSGVTVVSSNGKFNPWRYGLDNSGNLFGTIKSLDELGVTTLNCTQLVGKKVHDESLHCEWGVASRLGWAVVDDSDNYVLDANDYWSKEQNHNDVDLYFFGHGTDYKGAVKDLTVIGGKVAMAPRYTMGIMWSRWYDLDHQGVKDVVEDYEDRKIPLDVFILDMDWHSKQGWGGYSFDRNLFPQPADTMAYLHSKNLHSSANLHDDDGVRVNEDMYTQYAQALGLDPATAGTIPMNLINSTHAYALEDIVVKHDEDLGMDFWWIDWQQPGTEGGLAGGKQNPTIWLNHLRCTDHIRRDEDTRGVVLARWGGLGNHRYQLGFSGDVAGVTWQNLAYQPFFSWSAANVGFGYWSHDIVGAPASPHDYDLHSRWIQWGAFSGVFRTHDRGMSAGSCADSDSCGIVEVWNVPQKYERINKAAMRSRSALLPYIYTQLRSAFDSGVGLIRPMYYEFPDAESSYSGDLNGNFAQYMFGPDILVAPVLAPAATQGNTLGLAAKTIFLPQGNWYDVVSGSLISVSESAGKTMTNYYDISEIPHFVYQGAIIARLNLDLYDSTLGIAHQQYQNLEFSIYPGGQEGNTEVYEDDGSNMGYLKGESVSTTASYSWQGNVVSVVIESTGSYPTFPKSRTISIRLPASYPPSSVQVAGTTVPYSRFGSKSSAYWTYDGEDLATVIVLPAMSTSDAVKVSATFEQFPQGEILGVKHVIRRALLAKANLDEVRKTLGSHKAIGGMLMQLASSGANLEYLAGQSIESFDNAVVEIPKLYLNATNEVQGLTGVDGNRLAYSVALLKTV